MKKKVIGGALFLVILIAAVQGTVAYFTRSIVTHNVITSGAIDIELEEFTKDENDETIPWKDVEGITPGEDVSKIVRVKNTGPNDAWVRIVVKTDVSKEDGSAYKDGDLVIDFDTTYWTQKDGEADTYYYKQKLLPGAVTEPLFETVSFSTGMGNDYQNATIEISVEAHGTQYDNNGATVLEAKGWPKSGLFR